MKRYLKELPLLILVLFFLNTQFFPVMLRFTDNGYNKISVIVFLVVLPISVLVRSLLFKNIILKIIGVISFIPIFCMSFIILIIMGVDYNHYVENKYDSSFRKISDVKAKGYNYRLYIYDCGAVCTWVLVLRKERALALGIKSVEPVYRKPDAREGSLTVVDYNILELRIEPLDKGGKIETFTYNIK